MRAPHSRPVRQRHLVWLLWAALLLPIAQTATAWHALSVARVDGGDAHGKQWLHHTHCDFCLTAAALSSGALAGEQPASPLPTGRHEAPQAASSGDWFAFPTCAYRSRAPPFASH